MNFHERIKLAAKTWLTCQKYLPPEFAGAVRAMDGDPAKFNKLTPDSARLRVRPVVKTPANFWGGWTWYELHVGKVPNAQPAGLNVGGIFFIQSSDQKASGSGAYTQDTYTVLRNVAPILGREYFISPPADKKCLSLGRVYRMAHFPADQAGQDFARLIVETLPLLTKIVDTE